MPPEEALVFLLRLLHYNMEWENPHIPIICNSCRKICNSRNLSHKEEILM